MTKKNKTKKTDELYAVIGLGRFGMALAKELSSKGKNVMVIDMDREKVDAALEFTDNAFVIGALTYESLEETGIAEADVAVICIGEKIDVSILATLNVIRLGSDGISRSSTGIDGPFTSIISMNGAITGNLTGNVTGNLTGNVSVVISGTTLAQLLGMALGNENVAVIKATNPFALVNGSGELGYRYGGSAGSGSYGAPHYFSGNVIIDGDLTVTGTITQQGGSE